MHNEHKTVENLISRLKAGETIALIQTLEPCISDPGFLLTRACVENGITVECLPGAAFVPALVKQRAPNDKFILKFLPEKRSSNAIP
jgi:16S rRNA (cytidine1402-2'-O)-methyltransferase